MRFRPITDEEAQLMREEVGAPLSDDGLGMTVEGESGAVMAKFICYNWTQNSCFIHMVIKDPKVLEKNVAAREVFDFTFRVRGCIMLLATASSLNEGSLALQKAYGFEEVCRIPDAISNGEDLVISRLTRDRHEQGRVH